jgi:outer membrane protein TolC
MASETWLQLQIAGQMEEAAQHLLSLADKRYQVGIGNDLDVALAQASLGTFQDNTLKIRLAHEQAIRALELLIGRYPATELKARQDLTKLPGPVPVGIPLEMLERRPDLIAAEHRVAAAFNRVGEAKTARLPRISLNASVAAFTSEVLQLKEDFENPTGGFGGRILAPVYQGGALQTQVEIATLAQKEAIAQYGGIALRALGEVENSLAASENLAERELLLQRNVGDNQRALELAERSYRVGTTDLRKVQQQLISLNTALLGLLRVQSEQLSQRVNLHLALGGSFSAKSEN